MGIIDNIRRIIDGGRIKNMERHMANEVARSTVTDTKFYKEYGSFANGMEEKLETVLVDENLAMIVYRPKFPEYAKYFREMMNDKRFNKVYKIEKTAGGEFQFSLIPLDAEIENKE